LLNNLQIIRQIAANTSCKEVQKEIRDKVESEEFERNIREEVELLSPFCTFIDKVQSRECSLADSVEHWLDIKVDLKKKLQKEAKSKRDAQILTEPALIANSLHPVHLGKRLSNGQKALVKHRMQQKLSLKGFEQFLNFLKSEHKFNNMFLYQLDAQSFWETVSDWDDCAELAEIALKYLHLPSSTASLERVFSMWSFVHNKIRNRLTQERSKKLLTIYHHFKTNAEI
jgi:hypothetical protein